MQRVALDIVLATVVYTAVSLAWSGAASPVGTLFSALVFAMAYGAIRVAMIVFRGQGE
ncbi:hypothetical protein [Ruegeria aquimaris]|uniref:Uncharacterized protein n=1 Tax=Ruegeria aquimaris TaxID=2984333 RepID=A0ABT3AN52_9RHOB|nr:hypothetical protein [Ruegeria sp. XHP0148]MCV2890114.1 hypothetical protein [Ruegeria sp. XHP0148]